MLLKYHLLQLSGPIQLLIITAHKGNVQYFIVHICVMWCAKSHVYCRALVRCYGMPFKMNSTVAVLFPMVMCDIIYVILWIITKVCMGH